jgi:hypothetical protein
LIQDFKQFSQSTNPALAEQKVKELLSTGQMSQEQYNQLGKQAQQFMSMLNIK